ncbi:MAG: DUF4277 domain-containing protein [Actinomycetota bacterium]|nr:DUF4277 domain-containing protein [Actinomycetota bacterium]
MGTRREVGPLLLVAHYLRRLGLVGLVDDAAPMRGRSLLSHGEVITALVANRLAAPSPLYDVAGWASSAAVAELFAIPAGLLNDDRLGRGPSKRWRRWPSGSVGPSRRPPCAASTSSTPPGCTWT